MNSVTVDRAAGLASSTAVKGPCRVATSSNITLSGEQTINGVAVVTGDRVLVRSQTDATQNGIYVVSANAWTRAKDFSRNGEVRKGTLVVIGTGTVYAVTSADPIIIGTSIIAFAATSQQNSASNFGAVGDGVTDNMIAIDAAALEDNGAIYLPPGEWKYGTNDFGPGLAGKRFYGPGSAKAGVNRQARNFAYLRAQPAYGDSGSMFTAFNGDYSKTLLPMAFRIGGATTLGDPDVGDSYVQHYETAAIAAFGRVDSDAGKNAATDWTDGRTGWAFQHMKIDHHGQGDATAITIGVDIWSNRSGGTHFLAQPAGNCLGGGVTAWADHVNAVVGEFTINGRDKDINGTGFALHFLRNNATGAQEAQWRGVSIISSGTQAMDMAFVARGKINRGFDIGLADLGANQAAIAMSADQRIYGAVTYNNTSSANPLASGYKVFGAYNSAWFRYGSSTTKWDFNNSVNLITGNAYHINNVQVLGARDTGWAAMTGTANKNTVYDTATVTLAQLAGRVMALQAALTTHGSIGT